MFNGVSQKASLAADGKQARPQWSLRLAVGASALLLLVAVPLHLCMPLFSDVIHYDLSARNVLRGGVHYRDVLDINLPGMVWVHMAARSLLGWRSEPMRALDFLVVCAVVWLLVGRTGSLGLGAAARAWTAFALFLFYFSTSEWVHCQRDTWMLPPALLALRLRQRQWDRLTVSVTTRSVLLSSLAEGLCWGAAFWLKPFVAVPALCCWLLTVVYVWRQRGSRPVRILLPDTAGLLAGGLLVGGLGVLWLWHSGAWPYLWNILSGLDREYLDTSQQITLLSRLNTLYNRLWPWGLVHLVAVPVACGLLARVAFGSSDRRILFAVAEAGALLAAFYVGWLFQALCLQLTHDYVLAPATMLGLAVAAGGSHSLAGPRVRWVALTVFAAVVLLYHPLRRPHRLEVWGRCWTEGSTPEIRNRLTMTFSTHTPDWVELQAVAEYLRGQQLRDRELTCFTASVTPLYLDLDVTPSSRALHFEYFFTHFPSHLKEMSQELSASPQRYVVSDLSYPLLKSGKGFDLGSPSALSLAEGFPPDWAEVFPWYEPIVFRTSRYLVHRVTGPVRELDPDHRKRPQRSGARD